MRKSDALVEEIMMQMATDAGCTFEKIHTKSVKRREHEKAEEVVIATIRVAAPDLQTLKGFTVMLGERCDRIHQLVSDGLVIYTYEAFQRSIRAIMREGVIALIIYL